MLYEEERESESDQTERHVDQHGRESEGSKLE